MATVVGSGEFRYEAIEKWPDLPDGRRLIENRVEKVAMMCQGPSGG